MARRVRDFILESRAAREKLKPRGKPYYRAIGQGLHVGYRKSKAGSGRWVLRLYLGEQDYRVETMADADDRHDANGATVLNFWQAQQKARDLHAQLTGPAVQTASRVYTVASAIEDYLQWLDGNRKSASDARWRANALILPKLGDMELARLTAKDIRSWLSYVARQDPRIGRAKTRIRGFAKLTRRIQKNAGGAGLQRTV